MRRLPGFVLAAATAAGAFDCHSSATPTAPALSVQCSANPSSGTQPLAVAFGLDVAGAQGAFSVAISYGDGTSGSDPDSPHLYTAPGSYVASFTVSTPSQSARCSTAITVAALPTPPPNQPPEVDWKTTPAASGPTIAGPAALTVEFNACRSVDPDGDRLYFKMDLDGDRIFEYHGATGADCGHTVVYPAGTHTATICVTDVDCPTWPACEGLPPLHPFQCRTYTVVATP